MILVKTAIESGTWLHMNCHSVYSDHEQGVDLRIKVTSFEKIDMSEVDDPEELESMDDGIYWIMHVEVVNLMKVQIRPRESTDSIVLVDQDGFTFATAEDSHLVSYSEYAKKSSLERLSSTELRPKIKARGAIAFLLPDDDFAKYSISVDEGTIIEA